MPEERIRDEQPRVEELSPEQIDQVVGGDGAGKVIVGGGGPTAGGGAGKVNVGDLAFPPHRDG